MIIDSVMTRYRPREHNGHTITFFEGSATATIKDKNDVIVYSESNLDPTRNTEQDARDLYKRYIKRS